jgi:hypothetical protein
MFISWMEFAGISYMLFPLLLGAALHGICMKYDILSWMAVPIDGGLEIRGRPLFGQNKTLRGVLLVAIGCMVGWGLQCHLLHQIKFFRALEPFDYGEINGFVVGFAVGSAAMLSELPNSFIKRRLGIPPGQGARGVMGPIFYIWDQVDILAGVWLVLMIHLPPTLERVAISAVLVLVVHQSINTLGYLLGMRRSSR